MATRPVGLKVDQSFPERTESKGKAVKAEKKAQPKTVHKPAATHKPYDKARAKLDPKMQPAPTLRAGGFGAVSSTVYGTRELIPPDMQRALENTTIGIELEAIGKQLDKIAEGVKSKKALLASELKEGKPLTRYMDLLSGLDFIMIEGSLSQHLDTLTNPDRGKPTEAEKGFIHKVQRLQSQLAQVQAEAEKYVVAAARAGIE